MYEILKNKEMSGHKKPFHKGCAQIHLLSITTGYVDPSLLDPSIKKKKERKKLEF